MSIYDNRLNECDAVSYICLTTAVFPCYKIDYREQNEMDCPMTDRLSPIKKVLASPRTEAAGFVLGSIAPPVTSAELDVLKLRIALGDVWDDALPTEEQTHAIWVACAELRSLWMEVPDETGEYEWSNELTDDAGMGYYGPAPKSVTNAVWHLRELGVIEMDFTPATGFVPRTLMNAGEMVVQLLDAYMNQFVVRDCAYHRDGDTNDVHPFVSQRGAKFCCARCRNTFTQRSYRHNKGAK